MTSILQFGLGVVVCCSVAGHEDGLDTLAGRENIVFMMLIIGNLDIVTKEV
jgi:hypothetical protein